jgi:hypothetical protein
MVQVSPLLICIVAYLWTAGTMWYVERGYAASNITKVMMAPVIGPLPIIDVAACVLGVALFRLRRSKLVCYLTYPAYIVFEIGSLMDPGLDRSLAKAETTAAIYRSLDRDA